MLQPRAEGALSAIGTLLTDRQRIDSQRTMNRNASNALIRKIDLGIDARKASTDRQLVEIGSWREHPTDDVAEHYARTEATRRATAVGDTDR
ncbi:hypothetical protein [Glutamicibacter sp.]|uniref:hypothetical protein n=1 Tax=Glutamicibacter sp. TaxID=1931995 RepID=UPI003FA5C3D2